jgi:splicing factor 3B subunit 2
MRRFFTANKSGEVLGSVIVDTMPPKLTASQRKNLKKKAARERRHDNDNGNNNGNNNNNNSATNGVNANNAKHSTRDVDIDDDYNTSASDIQVEYVPESMPTAALGADDALADVLSKFAARAAAALGPQDGADVGVNANGVDGGDVNGGGANGDGGEKSNNNTGDDSTAAQSGEAAMTNRERKLQRLSRVGKLKQLVDRPDVVEVWDATAADPEFLVFLKAYRNSVPVPRHWNRKKRYLQGKRGVDKKPYELPDFIQATGIARLREAYVEREETKRSKQKTRERLQPKIGKMDINYQVLHDAFFKHQKRPANLTAFGDLYYEGREFETNLSEARPGVLSAELRAALALAPDYPPPWLANMQRVGPPPSYPNLRIPGVNAPIPHGAQYGMHAGGWGKPPVDELGRPLYGDVFGTAPPVEDTSAAFDRTHWGAIVDESSDDEESADDDDSADADSGSDADADEAEGVVMDTDDKADAESGFSTVAGAGTQTPDIINLRKRGLETPSGISTPAGDGFTVLMPQRAAVGSSILPSSTTYQLGGITGAATSGFASTAPAGTATSEPSSINLTKRNVEKTSAAKDKSAKKIKSTF